MWRLSDRNESWEMRERVKLCRVDSSARGCSVGRGISSMRERSRSAISGGGREAALIENERSRSVRVWCIICDERAVCAVINLCG